MNTTIATFMAIDTDPEDSAADYPMYRGPRSSSGRRVSYWKNVITWGATARRCYPDARIVIATNDPDDVDLEIGSLHQTLDALGIERLFVPYVRFKPPPGGSRRYINIFYRFDSLRALVNAPGPENESIYLSDSDAVWVRRLADLDAYLPPQGLAFHSPDMEYGPYARFPHNMSRADMGETFRRIDPSYPEPLPAWYGVDFVGGRRASLRQFIADLEAAWNRVLEYIAVQPLLLANGESFMENDEHIGCYVLNLKHQPITPPDGFFLRLFTLEYTQGPRAVDTSGVIWHVPQEKERGLKLLYVQVLDRHSDFWTVPVEMLPDYLGGYLGVPKRTHDLAYAPREQLARHVRMVGRGLRRWNKQRQVARELKHASAPL